MHVHVTSVCIFILIADHKLNLLPSKLNPIKQNTYQYISIHLYIAIMYVASWKYPEFFITPAD